MRLGYFIKCPHPEMIEAMAFAEADFVVVDMEHTPLGPRDLYPLVLAAEVNVPFELIVRIPENSERYFKWCKDLGVATIQVPSIENMESMRKAITSAYFAPLGSRGLCRFVRAASFSADDAETYLKGEDKISKLIFQLEGKAALVHLHEIIGFVKDQNTRLDLSLFIGPYDLSQSLGIPGKIWDEKVVKAAETIIDCCKENSIPVGIFTDTQEGIEFWAHRGIDFIEYASDLHLLINAVQQIKVVASLPWKKH